MYGKYFPHDLVTSLNFPLCGEMSFCLVLSDQFSIQSGQFFIVGFLESTYFGSFPSKEIYLPYHGIRSGLQLPLTSPQLPNVLPSMLYEEPSVYTVRDFKKR
jgi:hypothetical protein